MPAPVTNSGFLRIDPKCGDCGKRRDDGGFQPSGPPLSNRHAAPLGPASPVTPVVPSCWVTSPVSNQHARAPPASRRRRAQVARDAPRLVGSTGGLGAIVARTSSPTPRREGPLARRHPLFANRRETPLCN
ncbi:unnamed protein product [Lampetra fluviatilis]